MILLNTDQLPDEQSAHYMPFSDSSRLNSSTPACAEQSIDNGESMMPGLPVVI